MVVLTFPISRGYKLCQIPFLLFGHYTSIPCCDRKVFTPPANGIFAGAELASVAYKTNLFCDSLMLCGDRSTLPGPGRTPGQWAVNEVNDSRFFGVGSSSAFQSVSTLDVEYVLNISF